MAENDRRSLKTVDGVLLVVGGLFLVWVAFAVLGFVTGLVWLVVKVAVAVAVVALFVRLLTRRR